MKSPTKPRPPKTVSDLMALLDLGEYAVKEGIKRGELPGTKVGRFFRIPAEAFERFERGEWIPTPRPLETPQPKPEPQMVKARAS